MRYDLTTVDWNPIQTELWLKFVEKNCPAANVTIIQDEMPIPWNWASGKMNCLKEPYATDRIIYIDTDTLIFNDPGHLFDDMGDASIGVSSNLSSDPMHKKPRIIRRLERLSEYFDFKYPIEHFSSGMLVMKKEYMRRLYSGWMSVMKYPPFIELFHTIAAAGELGLSIWLANDLERDKIYDIPLEVHGVLEKEEVRFGEADVPEVVHYHNYDLLWRHGFINDEIQRNKCGLEIISDKTVATSFTEELSGH